MSADDETRDVGGQALCAHADQDGEGAHWLAPGEKCRAGYAKAAAEAWTDHGYATVMHAKLAHDTRLWLKRTGRTQSWLADQVGFSEKHVSMMLSGLADGSFEAWEKVATALGCQWDISLFPVPSAWEEPGEAIAPGDEHYYRTPPAARPSEGAS